MLDDEELCPEYIAAIVGVVQSNVCITSVCVCQTTAYTDFGTHMHARPHTHTPRPKPSESKIMDIPLDPILSSHRGTRNAKKKQKYISVGNSN